MTFPSVEAFKQVGGRDGLQRKHNKILRIFEELGGRGTINKVSQIYRTRHPNQVRDVCGLIVGLYMHGRLNRDDNNPVVGETEYLQSVYFIPAEPLSREQVLNRQLEYAELRKAEATARIAELHEEINIYRLKIANLRTEYEDLCSKVNDLNRGEKKRLHHLSKILESGRIGRTKIRKIK